MGTRMTEALRVIFVSPELLTVAILAGLYNWHPSLFVLLGEAIVTDSALYKALPLPMTALSMKFSWEILFPKSNNRVLVRSPTYWMIKIRVAAALVWCAVGTLAFYMTMFTRPMESNLAGMAAASTILVQAVATASLFWARIVIRQIVEEYDL